ncbi:multidrug effflux MFS transporter [Paenibacillus tuaregi]|uniref:multidrug effflux MFS transporter n=1 Tax=Paenibacillus tuaregi TaxID=1816681 RepID=UPI000839622C|nr:multidrug effflux MFS transporter [Paenibacillus tuaregi]
MTHKAKRNSLGFALILATFSALGPFTVDMYLASLPQIGEFFETGASAVQASLTTSLLGLGLGQLIMGPLSDIYGRRRPLLTSMVLYILSSVGCAFAPSIQWFIVLRFIQGAAASSGLVISRAIVRDRFSGVEMTKFISLLTMISNVAPLISPTAGSIVVSYSSWVGVFIFLGGLGIALTGITTWWIKESLPIQQRVPSSFRTLIKNYSNLFCDRSFMGYALVNGILFAGVFAYVAGTPFIYQNIYGVSPQMFSILFGLNGLAIIMGSQFVKLLASRVPERQLFLIGIITAFISAAAIFLVVLSHAPLSTIFISIFLFAFSIGIIGPVSFTLAMESQGHIAGSASAVLGAFQFALGALTSPLVGIAGENSALPFGVVIFSTSLLSIITYIVLIKGIKRLPGNKNSLNSNK